jgi:CDP-diacylglycerol--serine O-phosphatidyltransferase
LSEQPSLSALNQAGMEREEDPEMYPDSDSSALPAKPGHRKPRGMFLLPSVFTAGNIAAGYFAITQSLQGSALEPQHFDYAALAIGFAIPFDALDGRIARMTNTTSEFGKELDSLADVITFGVAPSLLAYTWGFHALPFSLEHSLRHKLVELGALLCFLFLLCGAARLARFNSMGSPVPKNPGRPGRKYFVGMPIPAAAGAVAAVVHFFGGIPVAVHWVALLWGIYVSCIGFLMVSTWRFWSGKEINFASAHPFRLIVLIGAFLYALVFFSQFVLAALALIYMFSGVLARLLYSWRRKSARPRRV